MDLDLSHCGDLLRNLEEQEESKDYSWLDFNLLKYNVQIFSSVGMNRFTR
jgi:hypothetical protein